MDPLPGEANPEILEENHHRKGGKQGLPGAFGRSGEGHGSFFEPTYRFLVSDPWVSKVGRWGIHTGNRVI